MSFVHEVRISAHRRETESDVIRERAARIIRRLMRDPLFGQATSIERSLALGAACPFHTAWERQIWSDEIAKAEQEKRGDR